MNGDLVINYVEMLGPRTDAIVEAWGRIQVLAHAGVVTAAVGYAGQQWRFALARLYEGWGVLEMAAGENPPGEGSLFVSAAVMSLFALHRDEARTFACGLRQTTFRALRPRTWRGRLRLSSSFGADSTRRPTPLGFTWS